jgi:hypothetical protein
MRIMPEIEPFAFLDLPAHPLAKVSIVDLPFALVVLIDDQLRQVLEVKVLVLAPYHPQDVVHSDEAVIITIQIKESLANADPILGEFIFNQLL